MFTGLIEAVGTIESREDVGGDMRYEINTGELDLSDVEIGDSIAVNGVCLTVIDLGDRSFATDVSKETIRLTTLKDLQPGNKSNLEKALLPTTRLGGHLVSGHVDGLGQIKSISHDARSIKLTIKVPGGLMRYIAAKGSICVDGVSLTVNDIDVKKCEFSLNIVPHTQEKTIIAHYKVGQDINLEVDIIARYIESLLTHSDKEDKRDSDITPQLLADNGYIR